MERDELLNYFLISHSHEDYHLDLSLLAGRRVSTANFDLLGDVRESDVLEVRKLFSL